jgi:hypothetical protein
MRPPSKSKPREHALPNFQMQQDMRAHAPHHFPRLVSLPPQPLTDSNFRLTDSTFQPMIPILSVLIILRICSAQQENPWLESQKHLLMDCVAIIIKCFPSW